MKIQARNAVAPSYRLFPVKAKRVDLITPRMKRIIIDGSVLGPIRPHLPAQWLKVFAPSLDDEPVAGRAYTIRWSNPDTGELALDFFLHGPTGPVSAFAEKAEPGSEFLISAIHPKSGFSALEPPRHFLLFGDETALPAIASILEALPANSSAQAFVEVADEAEQQVIESAAKARMTWIHRNDKDRSGGVEVAARRACWKVEGTAVFAAGESSAIANIRKLFQKERGIDRSLLHASGYWKRGEADHRDAEGS